MSTMTLFETGESDGSVSLAAVVAGDPLPFSLPALTLPELAGRVCRGGLPYNVGLPFGDASDNDRNYIQTVADVDGHTVGGVNRDSETTCGRVDF